MADKPEPRGRWRPPRWLRRLNPLHRGVVVHERTRPPGATLLAILQALAGFTAMVLVLLLLRGSISIPLELPLEYLLLSLSLLLLVSAWGLLRQSRWARPLTLLLAIVALGGALLLALWSPPSLAGLLGGGPGLWVLAGIAAWHTANVAYYLHLPEVRESL
ncbi:MAG: hypothetical protein HY558_01450 [Euryarchaeota archaeon]|nr:hypothetical protein [Euryarchaeota archaeon]